MALGGHRLSTDETSDLYGAPDPGVVTFDYIKSNDFRVVWADGVIGGATPQGLLHFALYAERPALARRQVYKLDRVNEEFGKLGEELVDRRISRNSIVREMACDVLMSETTAELLANWLLENVSEMRERRMKGGDE
jgi:hypothetical protein